MLSTGGVSRSEVDESVLRVFPVPFSCAQIHDGGNHMEKRHTAVALGFCIVQACSGDAQTAAFMEACVNSSSMGEDICECVAGLASEELSEEGLSFLIASMQGDTAAAQQMAGEMTIQEATDAGLFMVSAPANCAAEQ